MVNNWFEMLPIIHTILTAKYNIGWAKNNDVQQTIYIWPFIHLNNINIKNNNKYCNDELQYCKNVNVNVLLLNY